MNISSARFLSLYLGVSVGLAAPLFAQNSKPHPALPSLAVPQALGVNIHFTDARPGELEMLAQGGFHVARMDFSWGATEKTKGVYDFSAYERLLKSLEANKVQPLFILDYSNGLYDEGLSPYSDAGRTAFATWAAAAAVHFKGHNILWEMYNEPNGFWKPKPEVQPYIELALATGKALKAAAPGECYVGPGVSGFDFAYVEACFKAGLLNYWDAVSVHPYRGSEPESAGAEYRRLRLMIGRYKPKGKNIPVLSGEWGYSTKGISETQQAQYLARQWLTNLANNIPVSIWYDWHNDGTDPKENEHNFGTTRFEYHEGRDPVYDPKPSYIAARTLTRVFNGFRFNKRLALKANNDYFVLFSRGKEVKAAVWTTSPAHEVTVPSSAVDFKITGYLGDVQPAKRAGKTGLQLTISDSPLYLEPQSPNAVLNLAAAWMTRPLETEVKAPEFLEVIANPLLRDSAPLMLRDTISSEGQALTQISQVVVSNPLHFEFEPGAEDTLRVHIENPNGSAFEGSVSLNQKDSQKISFVDGEQEKTLKFPFPAPAADGSRPAHLHFQGVVPIDVVDLNARLEPVPGFTSLTAENLAASLAANADGDPAITSEQTLSLDPGTPEAAPNGGPVLSLKYKMAAGWKFITIQPRNKNFAAMNAAPRGLGMWIYGDGSGNWVRMRYKDSGGQTFQPGGFSLTWNGWRYVNFPLDGSGGHWGGANDGEIHGPITVDTLLLLDSASQKESEGKIYFASPTWVY